MASLEITVRPATAADVRPLAAVMARAFDDDPPFVWMLLRRCDQSGEAAYLESSKLANVPLYEHFGFQSTGTPALPDGAPVMTAMWRPPAARPSG